MKTKDSIRRFLWRHFPDIHSLLWGDRLNEEEAKGLEKLIDKKEEEK
jgi:hypothetical protein